MDILNADNHKEAVERLITMGAKLKTIARIYKILKLKNSIKKEPYRLNFLKLPPSEFC